jgi:hypothetical protein
MGTALRFVMGFAGLLCIVLGLAVLAPVILGTAYLPDDSDFPGGLRAVMALQLVVGSWPLALGVYLFRKAVKSGAVRPETAATTPTASPLRMGAPAITETRESDPLPAIAPPGITPPATAPPVIAAPVVTAPVVPPPSAAPPALQRSPAARPRRTWLAVFGLCLTLPGLLILITEGVEIARGLAPSEQTPWDVTILVLLTGAVLVLLGLRLAYAGDPEIGRRLGVDLRRSVTALTDGSTRLRLIRTSAGLAFVTAVATLLVMAIWKEGSPLIALAGTMLFSIVDPIFNFSRRSWWVGSFISIPVWIALFMTLAQTAEAIAPMREGAMIFILPMMVYPAALGLSGLARFWMWAGRRSYPEAFN